MHRNELFAFSLPFFFSEATVSQLQIWAAPSPSLNHVTGSCRLVVIHPGASVSFSTSSLLLPHCDPYRGVGASTQYTPLSMYVVFSIIDYSFHSSYMLGISLPASRTAVAPLRPWNRNLWFHSSLSVSKITRKQTHRTLAGRYRRT